MSERTFNDHEQLGWLEKAAIRLSQRWGVTNIASVAFCLQKRVNKNILPENRMRAQPKLVTPTDANAVFFPNSYRSPKR